MILRNANINDAISISRVHYTCWHDTYPGLLDNNFLDKIHIDFWVNSTKDLILNDKGNIYVVEEDNQVVGDIFFGKGRSIDNAGEIWALYVLPDYQKQGFGEILIKKAINKLSEKYSTIYVKVLLGNEKALNFYKKIGFVDDDKIVEEQWMKFKFKNKVLVYKIKK